MIISIHSRNHCRKLFYSGQINSRIFYSTEEKNTQFGKQCCEKRNIMDVTTTSPIGQVLNESVTNASVYQPSNGTYWEHAPQFTRAALIRVYVLSILGIISLVGNVITVSIDALDCLSLFWLVIVHYCHLFTDAAYCQNAIETAQFTTQLECHKHPYIAFIHCRFACDDVLYIRRSGLVVYG